MARSEAVVDRTLLTAAIAKVEENGPLANQSAVWKSAAEVYNANPGVNPITHSVVCLRAVKWAIPVKTAKARVVTPTSHEDRPVKAPTHAPTHSTATLMPISIPAGEPPIKLTAFDEDAIIEWCERTLEAGEKRGHKYQPRALIYWARNYFHPGDADTFDFVRSVIISHFAEPEAAEEEEEEQPEDE